MQITSTLADVWILDWWAHAWDTFPRVCVMLQRSTNKTNMKQCFSYHLWGLGHDLKSKLVFSFFMCKRVYFCILNDQPKYWMLKSSDNRDTGVIIDCYANKARVLKLFTKMKCRELAFLSTKKLHLIETFANTTHM